MQESIVEGAQAIPIRVSGTLIGSRADQEDMIRAIMRGCIRYRQSLRAFEQRSDHDRLPGARRILVHGEEKARHALADKLEERYGVEARRPPLDEVVSLA